MIKFGLLSLFVFSSSALVFQQAPANCGNLGAACKSNEACVANKCQALPTERWAADGAPGCYRFGSGACCGPNYASCGSPSVCKDDQCQSNPNPPPAPAAMCGCKDKAKECTNRQCMDNECKTIPSKPLPAGVADGSPFCIRGAGAGVLCCGPNFEACNPGEVCVDNACKKVDDSAAECPAVGINKCGCDNQTKCTSSQTCEKGRCVDLPFNQWLADGAPGCVRGPNAGFCCGGRYQSTCNKGQTCTEEGKCVDECAAKAPAMCGCKDKAKECTNRQCMDNECKTIPSKPLPAGVADGSPFCIRGAGAGVLCCGPNFEACNPGEVCVDNACKAVDDSASRCVTSPGFEVATCGCGDKAKACDNRQCIDNECKNIPREPLPEGVADGSPFCIRGAGPGSLCCGEKFNSCKGSEVCANNKCVPKDSAEAKCSTPTPPKEGLMCGCDGLKCSGSQECVKGACRDIDFAPFAADGAPACVRGSADAYCCGEGQTSCGKDKVCTVEGECKTLADACPNGATEKPSTTAGGLTTNVQLTDVETSATTATLTVLALIAAVLASL